MSNKESKLRMAFLISGGGSTMERIIKECQIGLLKDKVDPVVVIASKSDAGGILKAQERNIPVEVIPRRDFPKGEEGLTAFGWALLNTLIKYSPDVVSQNGWTSMTPPGVIDTFSGKIFNQHPAPLDPDNRDAQGKPLDFGGKGMYGITPHRAVIKFQELTGRVFPSEATIHRVTPVYDQGGVVYRMEVPIEEGDTPEKLQQRVLPEEHAGQIIFWHKYSAENGQVPLLHRVDRLVKPGEEEFLKQAIVFALCQKK